MAEEILKRQDFPQGEMYFFDPVHSERIMVYIAASQPGKLQRLFPVRAEQVIMFVQHRLGQQGKRAAVYPCRIGQTADFTHGSRRDFLCGQPVHGERKEAFGGGAFGLCKRLSGRTGGSAVRNLWLQPRENRTLKGIHNQLHAVLKMLRNFRLVICKAKAPARHNIQRARRTAPASGSRA